MVASAREEDEWLTGDRDKIKFIDFRFGRGQVVGFGKEEGKMFHKLHVSGRLIKILLELFRGCCWYTFKKRAFDSYCTPLHNAISSPVFVVISRGKL